MNPSVPTTPAHAASAAGNCTSISSTLRPTIATGCSTGAQSLSGSLVPLDPLTDSDLERKVTIRGEPHSVMQAINRQIAHYAYHCGQIVFLAKHFKANEWKSLSVPRNRSAEFNRKVLAGEASQR